MADEPETASREHDSSAGRRAEALPLPLLDAAVELPPDVADVLGGPPPAPPERWLVEAPSLPWMVRGWGSGRPVLLLHGVTSSASSWWRIGPALAAAGRTAIAPDMPGHGETPPPPQVTAAEPFSLDAAARLVVELVAELDLPVAELAVVGHSWGALVAARLPAAGVRPRRLVLLDPPLRDVAWARERAGAVRRPGSREEAFAMALERVTGGPADELAARADALLHLDPATARAVFLSTPWDGALTALADPAGPVASGIATWVVRGDPAAGAYVPDEALPRYAQLIGASHVLTVAGGEHSFTRSHPRAALAALLAALS
ncbi:MAG: alpha/beta hydrolase [Chloroflexi bacterium]|nr:alpha/beta hydrolase [Chloroflexota bacterium]